MSGLLNLLNDELITFIEGKWLNIYQGLLYQNIKLIRFLRKVKNHLPLLTIPEQLKSYIRENETANNKLKGEREHFAKFNEIVNKWEQRFWKRLDICRQLKKDEWGQVTEEELIANKELFDEPLAEYEDIIISFLIGTWQFHNKRPKLIELYYKSIKYLQYELAIYNDDTLIEFIKTLPGHDETTKMEGAKELSNKHFRRPIHSKLFYSLLNRGLLDNKSGGKLTKLGSILLLPKEKVPVRRQNEPKIIYRPIGELTLRELYEHIDILKSALSKISLRQEAMPGWKQKLTKGDTTYSGEITGELEVIASLIEHKREWFNNEINEINAELYLEAKIKDANLTPGEKRIIKYALQGSTPPGMTPVAFRKAKFRLLKKI